MLFQLFHSRKLFVLAIAFLPAIAGNALAGVDFERLNGSDLGMGVGARAQGMAGAFVAVADDASTIYWNPAGLALLPQNQLYLSVALVEDVSAAAVAYRPTVSFFERYGVVVGLGYINRLSFKGDSGAETWSGYPSHLLDLAMVDVEDDFSGRVDSRTYDLRMSFAASPPQMDGFSVGASLVHIA